MELGPVPEGRKMRDVRCRIWVGSLGRVYGGFWGVRRWVVNLQRVSAVEDGCGEGRRLVSH